MDKRTKILAGVFGAVIAYAVLDSVVYPRWIEPLLALKERMVEAQETLDKLEDQDNSVELAKREYRRLAERVGSMELGKVENALRAKMNELITKHKLESANVSPSRGSTDKTGIERMVVSITAVGTLESIILFMQDITELPHLIRVGNITLYPATSSKRNEKTDKVNVRVPIEVVVLPQQRILGERLKDKDFKQPEKLVRHQGRDYSPLWKKTPFTEFVALPTLAANAGPPQTVTAGQATTVQGGATGGDGQYKYEWSGPGVSGYVQPSLVVETSTVGQQTYTLIVRDGSGNSATSAITITVTEKPAVAATVDIPPPPPPAPAPTRQTWPDRNVRQLAMTLNGTGGANQKPSVLVVNQSTRQRTFHAVGDDFDGGKLEFVDTRGAVARWEDKFYIYPLGAKLDQDLPPERATGFPELLHAVEQMKLATKSVTAPATPEGSESTGGTGSSGSGEPMTPPSSAVPPTEGTPAGDQAAGAAHTPTETGQAVPAQRASPPSGLDQMNAQAPAVEGVAAPSPTPTVVEPAKADSNSVPGTQVQAPIPVPEEAKKLANPRGKKRPSRGNPVAANPAPEQNQNPSGEEKSQPENNQE